ncbi:MAG: hypothetical protein ACTTGU_05485 [Moraxella sp.]
MKKFILAFLALALSQNALAVDDWIEPYGTYLNTNKASAVKIYYTMGGRGEDMVSSSLCPNKTLASVSYDINSQTSHYRDKRGSLTMTTSVSTKELQMIKIEGSHPCFPAATYKKISDDINKSGSKSHK